MTATILWRRLDHPGHEFTRLTYCDSRWQLSGSAVFLYDRQPCQLSYQVLCDTNWQTVFAQVSGWVGQQEVEVEISVAATRDWQMNGNRCEAVRGCYDLDLNFSPSTNLLPIRRLNLAIGQAAEVRAAWLRFPEFRLEPLEQIYRRLDDSIYQYENAGGEFITELQVNEAGFVTEYPNFWQVINTIAG